MPTGRTRWRTSSDTSFSSASEMGHMDPAMRSAIFSESESAPWASPVVNPYIAGQVIPIDPEFERRTIAKVEQRLICVLGVMYAWTYIDYNNLQYIRVDGRSEIDLGLSDRFRYNLANLVFWGPFIAFQLPSVLALRRVGVSMWLSALTFLLGALQISMAFVNDWQQLVAHRVLIGALEAVMLPACLYLMSCWYTRKELSMPFARFYYVSVFLSSFWGYISHQLGTLHVTRFRPMNGWRWIPVFGGIFSVFTSVYVFTTVIDFPDKNVHLTREETTAMQQRVELDRGDAVYDSLTWAKCWKYVTDWKIWAFGYLFMATIIPVYTYVHTGQNFIYPFSVPNSDELTIAEKRILMAPSGVVACIYGLLVSRASQVSNLRYPYVLLNTVLTICGLCLNAFPEHSGARFTGGFLILAGAHGNVPLILVYLSNNIRLQSKRAFSSAFVCSLGGVGGLITQLLFDDKFAPRYTTGMWVAIGSQIAMLFVVAGVVIRFADINRKRSSTFGNGVGDAPRGSANDGLRTFLYTL